jgi:hypothetical protein
MTFDEVCQGIFAEGLITPPAPANRRGDSCTIDLGLVDPELALVQVTGASIACIANLYGQTACPPTA